MSLKFLIGGDIVPTESNSRYFEEADADYLIGPELQNLFKEADYLFLNLEAPLTDHASPIEKCGPNLIAPSSAINGLKAINPHCYGLANNHIMDQGAQGLFDTISLLDTSGLSYVGAGNNISEAHRPLFFEKDGLKLGLYTCAEHEFTIARETYPGANPYDPLESFDHVAALSDQCDFTVVVYHGGKEYYRYPSPLLQKTCRKFVDKGANLVVCQHSHCVGCEEEYEDGRIIYGQGNFLFDLGDDEFWSSGIVTSVELGGADGFCIKHYPITKSDNAVRLAVGEAATEILNGFISRSEQIKEPGFVEQEYINFSKRGLREYHMRVLGFTFFSRLMNKLSFAPYFRNRYSRLAELAIVNMLECEAHRELASTGFLHSGKAKGNSRRKEHADGIEKP